MTRGTCMVAGCPSSAYEGGLCKKHRLAQLRGKPALPCPKCGEPMREPAAACGFCALELVRRTA